MTTADQQQALREMLSRHDIELPPAQLAQLDAYRAALWQWNLKLNLTRHTDLEKFVGRDVVDSLAFEPFLEPGGRVLDVGTGGGVPGAVLAIVRPDLKLTLCESVGKRAIAASAIVQQAGLDVPVVHARAEDLLAGQTFETLVARAVAPLPKLLRWLEARWDAFEQLLVVTGPSWVAQRREARQQGLLRAMELRVLATYATAASGAKNFVLRIRPQDARS